MREIVAATLEWTIEYWPDLLEARMPLTTKPLRQTRTVSNEEIVLRDAAAHMERYFRNNLSWGESPAPVDVDVLQIVLDLLVYADDLADDLAHATVPPRTPLAPPALGQLDARPYLRFARDRLSELDDEWADWAAPRVQRMHDRMARALGMLYHGQTVKVVCPWCKGRTAEQPVGGAHTWQVEVLPSNQIAIICHGINCDPPAEQVTTWLWGKPCWPINAWERLAKHV